MDIVDTHRTMEIISYNPSDDEFWIGCSEEEMHQHFIPILKGRGKEDLNRLLQNRKERTPEYCQMVMHTLEIDHMYYMFFNVSRDLTVCFAEVPHFPFSHMWNAYSPFRRCKHLHIDTLQALRSIQIELITEMD